MGKNISKEESHENIVVAQSGSNSAQLEQKLEKYGMFIFVTLVLLSIMIVYCVIKKLNVEAKRWMRKQIVSFTRSVAPAQTENATTPPQVIYA